MRLGLCCINNKLRSEHIFTSRTCRLETVRQKEREKKGSGIAYVQDLFRQNLEDLLKVLEWNEANGIRVFRMSSEMAPHITNHRLFHNKNNFNKPLKLVWSMRKFAPLLRKIGDYAKLHGHRLTFHPGQFVVLSSPNPNVVINSIRDLWWHTLVMDMMDLPLDSIINIHGGGLYGDKESAIWRWVHTFNKLPVAIKRRLVIENDEESFSIEDVLEISRRVKWVKGMVPNPNSPYRVPVTFDIFHYYCYNKTLLRRYLEEKAAHEKRLREKAESELAELEEQRTVHELLPEVASSWGPRRPKMHISEQLKGGSLGAHSDFIKEIPREMLLFSHKMGFDLMIEAKAKEAAVLKLMKKYKKFIST
jgi:UV DNA damage endonuclease